MAEGNILPRQMERRYDRDNPRFPEIEVNIQRELCRVEKKNWRNSGFGWGFGDKYGGYRKDILKENLTERDEALLICDNCKGIMREAIMSSKGERFCSCCEERERPLFKPSKQVPNVALRKMISSLKCCCPLNNRGCKWLGTLNDCEDHLLTCGYVKGQCRLECREVLQRNKLKAHEIEDCSLRKVRCEHCDKELIFRELPRHLKMCPKIEVSCKLCDIVMCREDMTQHLEQDCVEKEIECPFAKYKCEVGLIKRKYLSQHLEEKETKHLGLKLTAMELKLNAMEELIMKQNAIIEKLNSTSSK